MSIDFDDRMLSTLSYKIFDSELRDRAKQTALETHPVIPFVLNGDFEDISLYPAIGGKYEKVHDKPKGRPRKSNTSYMVWSPPGHGESGKNCGTFRRADDGYPVIKHCTHCDYTKMEMNHCWSPRCPRCLNDWALKKGYDRPVERLTSYIQIKHKQGSNFKLKHFILSPPQNLALNLIQTKEGYDRLKKSATDLLLSCGLKAGVMVFHPWRSNGEGGQTKGNDGNPYHWRAGPHFHIVGVGFIDTKTIQSLGWVIKNRTGRQTMRSIGQTVAYLLTHAGISHYERSGMESNFDWTDIKSVLKQFGDFPESHIDKIDWTDWTMKHYYGKIQPLTYIGGVSYKKLRKVADSKDMISIDCPKCRAGNITSKLCYLHAGQPATAVNYIQRSSIMVEAKYFEQTKLEWLRWKTTAFFDCLTLGDFVSEHPHCSVYNEISVEPNVLKERKDRRSRVKTYVPSHFGVGIDTVYLHRDSLEVVNQ